AKAAILQWRDPFDDRPRTVQQLHSRRLPSQWRDEFLELGYRDVFGAKLLEILQRALQSQSGFLLRRVEHEAGVKPNRVEDHVLRRNVRRSHAALRRRAAQRRCAAAQSGFAELDERNLPVSPLLDQLERQRYDPAVVERQGAFERAQAVLDR